MGFHSAVGLGLSRGPWDGPLGVRLVPGCSGSAARNPSDLPLPRVCQELRLDLRSQKLCKRQGSVLQAQKSDYSLDDLLNRALPPCFGCFNGILLNLSHSPQGQNLPLFVFFFFLLLKEEWETSGFGCNF